MEIKKYFKETIHGFGVSLNWRYANPFAKDYFLVFCRGHHSGGGGGGSPGGGGGMLLFGLMLSLCVGSFVNCP